MKNFTLILFCCCIFFNSCKEDCADSQKEIKTIMKGWYKKKIILPQDMEVLTNNKLNNDQEIFNKPPKNNNYSIIHFFTADCDKCVNELLMIKASLKTTSNSKNINYIFIASAPTKAFVIDAIKKTDFPYPIYYEKQYYSFKTINKFPVSDDVFDTMLLNSNQEVILFGAFYDNDKAKNLYAKAIECNL